MGGATGGEGQVAPRYQAAVKPTGGRRHRVCTLRACRSACTVPTSRYGARASAGQARRLLRAGVAGTRLGWISCAPPHRRAARAREDYSDQRVSAFAAGRPLGVVINAGVSDENRCKHIHSIAHTPIKHDAGLRIGRPGRPLARRLPGPLALACCLSYYEPSTTAFDDSLHMRRSGRRRWHHRRHRRRCRRQPQAAVRPAA